MNLEDWGWNSIVNEHFKTYKSHGLSPGRVVKEQRHLYTLVTGSGLQKAEVSGAFQYKAINSASYPAIGDWVVFRPVSDDILLIEEILPRYSCFSRKSAGNRTDEQILAVNIDTVYLVFGIDGGRNFTEGALERYLTLVRESGAEAVILLNKADLCSEEEKTSALLRAGNNAPGVAVHLISAVSGEGIKALFTQQEKGKTIALAGPSGVGKSTIINYMSGMERQKTSPQRKGDLKGRHTTSHKEMFQLPTGHILVDTPGLKELQLWANTDSLDDAFPDIVQWAKGCRFKNCSHEGDPGCAVQDALASGNLAQRRYLNYLSLLKEIKYLRIKQDASFLRLDKEKWKNIAKLRKNLKQDNKT